MILIAILALLLSSATGTASQDATGTASLNTIVRRGGPVADLSVPLVALHPKSPNSALYSLTSLTGPAARAQTLTAFDRRCNPTGCVPPRSNTPGNLRR